MARALFLYSSCRFHYLFFFLPLCGGGGGGGGRLYVICIGVRMCVNC